MPEERDDTTRRATMPALSPEVEGEGARSADPAAAEWSRWLEPGPGRDGGVNLEKSEYLSLGSRRTELLRHDDPMAPLMAEARRRTLAMRRRQQIIFRAALAAALVAVLAAVSGGVWMTVRDKGTADESALASSSENAAPAAPTSAAPGVDWCAHTETSTRVVSAKDGDPSTGAGVILHLEYAWYVLRDPVAVRNLLTPDAQVASESATRAAITAIPTGTQHCVAVSSLGSERWDVQIDERHPDGSLASWQQTMTTAVRDGRTMITSIVAGG
ncbi:hypothetical protein AB0N05_08765 [Nocardia sp. NPDC051030]|uniref:hypothetical protein n=1 Tax=Nocardia sp. NPDC051030 TaxID=3155162 RepID=UPI00343039E6